jgi:hypothetical protein
VLCFAQTFDAFDLNLRVAGAAHARAHLVQQFGEVADFRFARAL